MFLTPTLSSSLWRACCAWVGCCSMWPGRRSCRDGRWCLHNHIEAILILLKFKLIKWQHSQRELCTKNALKGEHFDSRVPLKQIQTKLFPLFIVLYLLLSHLLHGRGRTVAKCASAIHPLIGSTCRASHTWSLPKCLSLSLKRIAIEYSHLLFQFFGYILCRMVQCHHNMSNFRVRWAATLLQRLLLLWIVRLKAGKYRHISLFHERMEAERTTSLLLHSLIVQHSVIHWHVHCRKGTDVWLIKTIALKTNVR